MDSGAAFGTPLWLTIYTTIVLGVGIGVLAQPQLAVRFMTVKSEAQLNRGVMYGGIFILFMTGVAFVVGALSNVVFFKDMGMLEKVVDGVTRRSGHFRGCGRGNIDKIIPMYIEKNVPRLVQHYLPPGHVCSGDVNAERPVSCRRHFVRTRYL